MNVDFDQQDIIIELPPEGKDGRSIHPAGEWSADAEYHSLDIVSYQGSSYMATRIVPVGTLPTDVEYWQIIAEGGAAWGDITGNITDQTDLANALNSKADVGTSYTKSEEDALLAQKANASEVYTKTETDSLLSDKADVGDSYTKAEEDALLAGKANASDVYTKAQTDTLLEAKADTADLGTLAGKDSVDYQTEVTNKPTLGTMALVNDAPSDNKQYARKNGQWAEVQGGGEPGGSVWGLIAGDLSDQTDLQEALDAKAPVILSSASGSIASFADGSASPVTALSVSIDPVQDLHGQDAPYPAGGGKNLCNPDTLIVGYYGNAGGYEPSSNYRSSALIPVSPNTQYYSSLYDKSGTRVSGLVFTEWDANEQIIGQNTSNPITTSATTAFIRIRNFDAQISYITGNNYNYQVEQGSSASGWHPYSNICPISGHTSATVTRTGKNLFEPTNVIDGYPSGTGISTSTGKSIYFPVVGGQTYTISKTGGTRFKVQYSVIDTVPAVGNNMVVDNVLFNDNSAMTATVTVPNNAKWIVAQIVYSGDDNKDAIVASCHVELGSTASAYEAPQIQQVTIDLNGTRYGAMYDALTGMMVVDRVKYTFAASDLDYIDHKAYSSAIRNNFGYTTNFPIEQCDCFAIGTYSDMTGSTPTICVANQGYVYIGWDNFDNIIGSNRTQIRTYFSDNPVSIVFPLAAPITVQLTPAQLSTLLGENHIWADTGDVSVEYRADTKRFVQGQIAETAKVTRQMIADSATADGKAPKSLATGDLIIVGDELRKATANIGNGSAITASNSTTATLADVIKALQ